MALRFRGDRARQLESGVSPRFRSVFYAAILTSLGIILPLAWFLVIPGFTLFLVSLRDRNATLLNAIFRGTLFGTVTGATGIIWFWDTLPLDFLGIHNTTSQILAITIIWVYVSLSLGLPIALAAPVLKCCISPNLALLSPFLTALVWVITERCRMWGFAMTTWGPHSLLGPHFSAAAIGYPLVESPFLRHLAYPFGIDALNFTVALIATTLVAITTHQPHWRRAATLIQGSMPFIITAVHAVGSSHSTPEAHPPLRLAVLANNYADVFDTTTHTFLRDQIAAVARAKPPIDVIVLPEEFGLTSLFWSQEEAQSFFKQHFGEREILILNTRNNLYPAKEDNLTPETKKLLYDSTTSGELARYLKRNLMPLGEYVPFLTSTVFSLISDPQLHQFIDDARELSASPSTPQTTLPSVSFRGVRIAGLLCSDLLSPSLYRTITEREHPDVLVNLANQFWFHGSRTLYWKTLQLARTHAVQNSLPFIFANNMAPSFMLDSTGEIVEETLWGETREMIVEVR